MSRVRRSNRDTTENLVRLSGSDIVLRPCKETTEERPCGLPCFATPPNPTQWRKEDDDAVMEKHDATQARMMAAGKLGPNLRLMPTSAAMTIRAGAGEPLVLDGPFAETKEALLGFWVFDAASLDEALDIAREFSSHCRAARSNCVRSRNTMRAACCRDRDRLDRRTAHRRATARGRRAAALFPRSRPCRGGVPGGFAAGAEDLAGERSAARSAGLADLRRPQRLARRDAPASQAAGAAGRRHDFRSR